MKNKARIKMIGLLAFAAASASAFDLPKQCKNSPNTKSYIEQKVMNGHRINIAHVYGDSAKDLYSDIDGDETAITEMGTEYIIKTQKSTEMSCFRKKQANETDCTYYECEL